MHPQEETNLANKAWDELDFASHDIENGRYVSASDHARNAADILDGLYNGLRSEGKA